MAWLYVSIESNRAVASRSDDRWQAVAGTFREIKVVHRSATGDRAWIVNVDPTVPIADLIPELVETLPIEGAAEDFDVRAEGSIEDPVLVLADKSRRRVGGFRQAD